jgi:hypothetical protein
MRFITIAPAMQPSPMFDLPEPIFIGHDGKAISPQRIQEMRDAGTLVINGEK